MKTVEDQYWYSGLHDAYVKKAERGFDDRTECKYLKLFIDADGAIYDTSVESITFYNYKIKKGNYNLTGAFWMSDTLKKDGNKYIMEIDYVVIGDKESAGKTLIIEFEQLEVSRTE